MGARRTRRGRSLILAASARTRSINSVTSISGLVDSIMLAAFALTVSPDSRKIQPWLRSHGPGPSIQFLETPHRGVATTLDRGTKMCTALESNQQPSD